MSTHDRELLADPQKQHISQPRGWHHQLLRQEMIQPVPPWGGGNLQINIYIKLLEGESIGPRESTSP